MTKRIFKHKKKKDPSLNRIIFAICTIIAIAYGITHFASWFNTEVIGGEIRAKAPATFEEARLLFTEGDADGARKMLQPLLERVNDPVLSPQILMFLADMALAEKNVDEALLLLSRAMNEYRDNPDHPRVVSRYARLLEDSGAEDDAATLYEQLRKTAPPEYRGEALLGLARRAEKAQAMQKAHELYLQAVQDATPNSDPWNEALDAVGEWNVASIFSSSPTEDSKTYIIQSGDSMTSIGIKLNTTLGLLTRANNIEDPSRIRVNQQIKYTPKDFRILIERSTCRLFLMDNTGIFKRYHVGLGMPTHQTSLGQYTIGNKQKDPTWYKPGGAPVAPNAPDNELGTRWIPLIPIGENLPRDLGIHGTIAPETIGLYKSHGCPRMKKQDVEELYDLVVRSTPVEIVETWDALLKH
jgi:lipoprotein-anchoring transpeptidase ErfK/SrfK